MEAGSPLILRTPFRVLELRALAAGELEGLWELPVLARTLSLRAQRGELEIAVGDNLWRSGAELVREGRNHLLRQAELPTQRVESTQRRAHARAPLSLLFYAQILRESIQPFSVVDQCQIRGRTVNVSAGGVAVEFTVAVELNVGDKLQLEVQIPGAVLINALAVVIAAEPGRARLRFLDLEDEDAVRLDALVVAAQRRKIASRRL